MRKSKKLIALLITGLMLVCSVGITTFGAEKQVKVTVDGKGVVFKDAQPYIDENSRTLVPIAFIAQALGANVIWDKDNFKVIIDKGEDTIVLKIGSNEVDVNGKIEIIDTKATLKDSRTFVPLAFISQCLGADVKWIESTWTVVITTKGNVPPIVEEPLPEGEVDLKDYFTNEPLSYNNYLNEKIEEYSFREVELGELPYKIKEIRPMSNLANIPNYVVDMGIVVVTEDNVAITIALIDKEGRYFGLTKTGNTQYSEDFFVSKEVAAVVMYVGKTKEAYIAKLNPTIKTGFSGTGELQTEKPRYWEENKKKLGL